MEEDFILDSACEDYCNEGSFDFNEEDLIVFDSPRPERQKRTEELVEIFH